MPPTPEEQAKINAQKALALQKLKQQQKADAITMAANINQQISLATLPETFPDALSDYLANPAQAWGALANDGEDVTKPRVD